MNDRGADRPRRTGRSLDERAREAGERRGKFVGGEHARIGDPGGVGLHRDREALRKVPPGPPFVGALK